jgi:hypothetical protein
VDAEPHGAHHPQGVPRVEGEVQREGRSLKKAIKIKIGGPVNYMW